MSSRMDLIELARHLRQEFLFVSSEKQNLQNLNEKVLKAVEHLYHLSWIARQQRLNLDNLILLRTDSHPTVCCQRANSLENANFIDSYKQLGVHDCSYAEFLQQFRENQKLIAMCLNAGEKINLNSMHNVVNIIMSAVYGNCILPEDEIYVLHLLKELMVLQLSLSDNPRRLLRHGSCAFSRVYKTFNGCLFSAKIFLTAALHEPIMHVLMGDDLFLDIDPSKAAIRFHPQERLRHFGNEGTPEYTANLQKYRNWTINKLYNLTTRFIEGIRSNLYCFPQSLSWLVRQIYNLVMKAKRVEVREIGAMCADLVFAFFMCPAIVDPELYGITDMHISYIARFNLMQVAQILQVLAMSKWEEIDPKLMDLYGKFEKDCMSSILDLILEGSSNESPSNLVSQFQDLTRSAILISESELMSLVSFLRAVEAEVQDTVLKKMIHSLISPLPAANNASQTTQNGDILSSSPSGNSIDNAPHTPSMKRSFIGKVGKKNSKLHNAVPFHDGHVEEVNNAQDSDAFSGSKTQLEDVLVVPVLGLDFECPGMLCEDKVLAVEQQKKSQNRKVAENEVSDVVGCGPEIVEKRTRFSLSQDQESIGASDNLEAISEAASNHSMASSLDLENDNDENENDNLSDMVSANVSGRGTPNVSGRDTPSSQLEGDDREQRPLDLTAPARKQNQDDIEDKFGKFEIQPMMEGDETKSMVSDTWSTDVLASDSETVEQLDVSAQMALESQNLALLDTSETASQSDAWSTDVLASDTERLQDVDTDDTASVARSDDTARSEADGEVPRALDGIRIDGCDFIDADHLSDPFIPGNVTKSYGCGSDFSILIPTRLPSSVNYTCGEQSSLKPKLPSFSEGLEGESDLTPLLESSVTEGMMKNVNKSDFGSDIMNFKVPELLNLDVSNRMHISAVDGNTSESSANDSLTDMQSLGRVSLAVKELPDAEDHDSGSLLLDSLQETVNMTRQSDRPGHRSSISDILSLDLTRTLNLCSDSSMSEDHLKKDNSKSFFNELEKDFSGSQEKSESSDCKKGEDSNCKTHPHFDRGSKRKLHDSSQIDDVFQRLNAGSVSSSGSSTGSAEISAHMNMNGEAVDLRIHHSTTDGAAQGKLSSTPLFLGAIPKSISFEKDLEHQELDDKIGSDKQRKSLFKLSGFRFTFKGRNRKSHLAFRPDGSKEDLSSSMKSMSYRTPQGSLAEMRSLQLEAGDEILAKYRKKSPGSMSATSIKCGLDKSSSHSVDTSESMIVDNDQQQFESASSEGSSMFDDAKRKLRLVLSSADFQTLPWLNTIRGYSSIGSGHRFTDNELVAFLKVLLAEALNLTPRPLMAHLHEALRCVHMFDDTGCHKLIKSLRDDYKKRAPYIAYLVRCRQGLLSTLSHLETIIERIERDKQVCNHYLIMICVRVFLEKHDIQNFFREFQELTVSDEKAALVENFLTVLFHHMESDPMWKIATDSQIEHARIVVERRIMDKIYTLALHPNGDGDVLRDKVLHEHMQKLSDVITPSHKDLGIPKHQHSQCPWPSAQAEIVLINAYKTPRDKIQCVVRCCRTIMNVLSMANVKMVPAADDLMPVLVYVLIKANPPNLLSTVQYVNTFYEKQLESEEAYWWTQFCSAVEFIKTMDY